jgi:amidophosphoribosyltransferase
MCAIFGIADHEEAANLTYLGLHALQHRGQEGAGIVSTDGEKPFAHRQQGLVGDVFSQETLAGLKGRSAIGHTRYSTAGGNTMANLQPMLIKSSLGFVSVAHNGNLTNARELIQKLEAQGSIFGSTNDTEVIVHMMARSGEKDPAKALTAALKQVQGAYSLLVLTRDKFIVARDPYGFRPLVMGELHGKPVFASETVAFDLIGATYLREVEPGEMLVYSLSDVSKVEKLKPLPAQPRKRCVFEFIYFARPDSNLHGESVHMMRKALGAQLAQEQPAPGAQVVIPIPDSGVPGAIGFAEQSGIPFDMGMVRSHYIGRTFIEPSQTIRDFGVKLKLNPVAPCVKGKSVVVVDDSLVRGTTSKKLIKHLRDAGAREVHLRITAPPTTHSCFYGIDTPTRAELLASSKSVEQIRDFIGADTLGYLSLTGLMEVTSRKTGEGFCHACFSGEYAVPVQGSC